MIQFKIQTVLMSYLSQLGYRRKMNRKNRKLWIIRKVLKVKNNMSTSELKERIMGQIMKEYYKANQKSFRLKIIIKIEMQIVTL